MTQVLKDGDTILLNGIYGLVAVLPADQAEEKIRLGHEMVWAIAPELPMPIYKILTVKGELDKEHAIRLTDKENILAEGRFYQVSYQRPSPRTGLQTAQFVYFDHVLTHIFLGKPK